VRLIAHPPDWAQMAGKTCLQIRGDGSELIAEVAHIDSTAVPDLHAIPILISPYQRPPSTH